VDRPCVFVAEDTARVRIVYEALTGRSSWWASAVFVVTLVLAISRVLPARRRGVIAPGGRVSPSIVLLLGCAIKMDDIAPHWRAI